MTSYDIETLIIYILLLILFFSYNIYIDYFKDNKMIYGYDLINNNILNIYLNNQNIYIPLTHQTELMCVKGVMNTPETFYRTNKYLIINPINKNLLISHKNKLSQRIYDDFDSLISNLLTDSIKNYILSEFNEIKTVEYHYGYKKDEITELHYQVNTQHKLVLFFTVVFDEYHKSINFIINNPHLYNEDEHGKIRECHVFNTGSLDSFLCEINKTIKLNLNKLISIEEEYRKYFLH